MTKIDFKQFLAALKWQETRSGYWIFGELTCDFPRKGRALVKHQASGKVLIDGDLAEVRNLFCGLIRGTARRAELWAKLEEGGPGVTDAEADEMYKLSTVLYRNGMYRIKAETGAGTVGIPSRTYEGNVMAVLGTHHVWTGNLELIPVGDATDADKVIL